MKISLRVIVFDLETKKFLLVRKSKNDPKFSGIWSLPGGVIKEGESLKDTLERLVVGDLGGVEYEIVGCIDCDARSDRADISFVVEYRGGEIALSERYDAFVWKTGEEIAIGDYNESVQTMIRNAMRHMEERSALDHWKRAVADFENYKKSKMNLERDMAGRAVEDFAYRLLPVVDNFHASTDHIPEDQKTSGWVQGIMYIQKQLEQVLGEMDVVEIETHVGDVFDPSLHEAVEHTDQSESVKDQKESEKKEDIVEKILTRGYKRGERMIRPVRVVVGNGENKKDDK